MHSVRLLPLAVVTLLLIAPLASAATMKERVCLRVVNRFSEDDKMWERVNNRVENRFGYRCNRDESQSTSPTRPSSVPSNQMQVESTRCTAADWQCGAFSACENGYQRRDCYKTNRYCIGTYEPVSLQKCTVSRPPTQSAQQKAEVLLKRAKQVHEELVQKARGLATQTLSEAGRQCLHNLHMIEESLVLWYNQYLEIQSQNVADSLRKYVEQAEEAPLVCF